MLKLYLIGSLRNPEVPLVGNRLREEGYDVFDDWHAAGPEADDCWQKYEQARGRHYGDALYGPAAVNIFQFDYKHLMESDGAVLILPAGKSGHLELGFMVGQGKPTFVLFHEEPERFDVMYQFATGVYFGLDHLIAGVQTTFASLREGGSRGY